MRVSSDPEYRSATTLQTCSNAPEGKGGYFVLATVSVGFRVDRIERQPLVEGGRQYAAGRERLSDEIT